MMELRWGKNAFNFEGMPSGPQPLRNLSRLPNGLSNAGQLVGDYRNPILTPEAAAVVKQKGELAIAGKGFANSQDQCRAIAPPFTFAMQLGFEMLPTKEGDIAIVYDQNSNVRHIRMNATHPAKLVPSSMGHSVGHWEGDTLVIDTVGVKVDAFTSVDRFGTPQSDAMHVVERYRLVDGPVAKAAQEAYETARGHRRRRRPRRGLHPGYQSEGIAARSDHGGPEGVYRTFDRPRHLPAPDHAMAGTGLRRQPDGTLQGRVDRLAQGGPSGFLDGHHHTGAPRTNRHAAAAATPAKSTQTNLPSPDTCPEATGWTHLWTARLYLSPRGRGRIAQRSG